MNSTPAIEIITISSVPNPCVKPSSSTELTMAPTDAINPNTSVPVASRGAMGSMHVAIVADL